MVVKENAVRVYGKVREKCKYIAIITTMINKYIYL